MLLICNNCWHYHLSDKSVYFCSYLITFQSLVCSIASPNKNMPVEFTNGVDPLTQITRRKLADSKRNCGAIQHPITATRPPASLSTKRATWALRRHSHFGGERAPPLTHCSDDKYKFWWWWLQQQSESYHVIYIYTQGAQSQIERERDGERQKCGSLTNRANTPQRFRRSGRRPPSLVSIKIFHREKWPGAVEASLIPSPAAQRRICLDKSVVICACVSRPIIIEMRNSACITQIA
jgi:hypothetical protein